MNERPSSGVGGPPGRGPLSRKATDLAKNLLSALFMAVRTAKIHDPSNAAFSTAVQTVFRAAEALYQATGGFSIQFVEDTIFLNGSRLRFDTSAFSTMRTLRRLMEEEGLGGLELPHPPKLAAIQKLVLLFVPGARPDAQAQAELAQEIRMLGVQRLRDERADIKVDRRVFAVQCYGKLVLAVREQLDRIAEARACDWGRGSAPPRLRLVRVVQDLVELGADRADFLLRLSTNQQGAGPVELHGANCCVLSIVMGHAIGIERQALVDVAVAALFHHIGAAVDAEGRFGWHPQVSPASLARLLAESGAGHSSYLRAMMVGELPLQAPEGAGIRAHPYSRMIKVAAAYSRLVTGFGERTPGTHPLNALARLYNADPGDIDRDFVDLLINVLRAFPVGCRVVLQDGQTAVVANQLGGARWDRPMVRIEGERPTIVDLSVRDEGRFLGRIRATARFLGGDPALEQPLEESAVPAEAEDAPTDLAALLEGEDIISDDLPPLAEIEGYGDDPAASAEPLELPSDALDFAPEIEASDVHELEAALDEEADPTLEGPADLAVGLELTAEPVSGPPDTQPALPSLSGPEPLMPLAPPEEPPAHTLVAASDFELGGELSPVSTSLADPPTMEVAEPDPNEQRWSALVPDGFATLDESLQVSEDALAQLDRLPDEHPEDTFDEDDDTQSG